MNDLDLCLEVISGHFIGPRTDNIGRHSTVGYPSDSLASCTVFSRQYLLRSGYCNRLASVAVVCTLYGMYCCWMVLPRAKVNIDSL